MTLKTFLLLYFLGLLVIFMPVAVLLRPFEFHQTRVHTVDLAEIVAEIEDFSDETVGTNGTVKFYDSADVNEDFWLVANEPDASAIPVVVSSAGLSVPFENASVEVVGTVEDDELEEGLPYLNASSWIDLDDVVTGTGTIRFLKIEGGFYGIVEDDGEHYDPVNLDAEFQVDGLRVRFEAAVMHDVLTFHMWGTLVSIRTIERL